MCFCKPEKIHNGFLNTKYGVFWISETGKLINISFTGGSIIKLEDGKLFYSKGFMTRKTRVYAFSDAKTPYRPLFDNDLTPFHRPFFCMAINGRLSLHQKKGDKGAFVVNDNEGNYYPFFWNKNGLTYMKVSGKMEPLIEGVLENPKECKFAIKGVTKGVTKGGLSVAELMGLSETEVEKDFSNFCFKNDFDTIDNLETSIQVDAENFVFSE